MHKVTAILIGIIALIHSYILVLEMFLWESRGPKVFSSFPAELFAQTKDMAANQGLYNGFLAAGLFWSLIFIKDITWKKNVALFFLSCIAVAGLFGAFTVSTSILIVQTVPALLAIVCLLTLKPKADTSQ